MGRVHQIGTAQNVGPQQNAVLNGQLEAAQNVGTTAAHQQRVEDIAEDIIEVWDESNQEPS
jgi:hypothetical protein